MNTTSEKLPLIKATLLFCLAVILGAAALLTLHNLQASLPQALEYTLKDGANGIALQDMPSVRQALGDGFILSAVNTTTAFVRTPSGRRHAELINLVRTDAAFPEINPLFLRKGAFLPDLNEPFSKRSCVISTNLATELFLSLDVVGQELLINDEAFMIIGAYKPNERLLNRISTDGREQIYIPYETSVNAKGQIDTLYVAGNTFPASAEGVPSGRNVTAAMRKALNSAFNHKLYNYECTDYFQSQRLLEQRERFFWFGIGLVSIIYIALVLVRTIKYTFTWVMRIHRSVEPVRLLPLARRMVVPFICIAAMAGIYYLCRFQIFWPPEYVPEGNRLLYLPFYHNLIISSFQKFNASGHNFYHCLHFYGSWAASGLSVACIIVWWRILANLWIIMKGKLPE